jgi:hypothetical protein
MKGRREDRCSTRQLAGLSRTASHRRPLVRRLSVLQMLSSRRQRWNQPQRTVSSLSVLATIQKREQAHHPPTIPQAPHHARRFNARREKIHAYLEGLAAVD